MGKCLSRPAARENDKEPDEVFLKQFTLMVSIGKGAFGKVLGLFLHLVLIFCRYELYRGRMTRPCTP